MNIPTLHNNLATYLCGGGYLTNDLEVTADEQQQGDIRSILQSVRRTVKSGVYMLNGDARTTAALIQLSNIQEDMKKVEEKFEFSAHQGYSKWELRKINSSINKTKDLIRSTRISYFTKKLVDSLGGYLSNPCPVRGIFGRLLICLYENLSCLTLF
ncbi:MAG: hypothetical protein WB791_11455, partial [Waddliaceae bacterium]